MFIRLTYILPLIIGLQLAVYAQTDSKLFVKPFENKVFIKEQGQFDRNAKELKTSFQQPILYGVENAEFNAYFTADAIIFQFPERKNIEEKSLSPTLPKGKGERNEESEERSIETTWHTATMRWLNTNPSVELVPQEKVSEYYNYGGFEDDVPINFVPAYKKIKYINLYPGVDVEFELPKEGGIKYRMFVHPNVVVPDIKFQWEGIENCFTDEKGDLHIKSIFPPYTNMPVWELQDHAPNAFTASSLTNIPIKYSVSGNTVQFNLENISSPEGIVIDPWIINPAYPGLNRAYDIQEDSLGNVFVHGNYSQTSSGNSYYVQKYNSLGVLQWTYITYSIFLGDIAVDNPGNIYIVGGFCSGKRQKLDPAGVQQWSFSGWCEEWRLAMNYSKTVLAICGYYYNAPWNNVNIAQFNMNTGAMSNQIAYSEETRSISTDCNGDMYSLHLPSLTLRKTNANFTPGGVVPCGLSLFYTGTGYAFNPDYSVGIYQGFNGNVIQGAYVYIYDGTMLRKFNKYTLTAINSVIVPNGVNMECSGLATDPCGNIYAGTMNGIVQYDSSLNYLSTISTTGPVYDILLSASGDLLACGEGFIGDFSITCTTPIGITATTTITSANCGSGGTATIAATGGIAPYTYLWQGGQTTATVTNLAPGTYIYVINDAFCKTVQDTVIIDPIPVTVSNFNSTTVCINTPPTQFSDLSTNANAWDWDFGDGSPNSTAQNPPHSYLLAGTYSVTLIASTLNGCPDTLVQVITVNPKPTANFTSPSVCFNNSTNFTDQSTGILVQLNWNFGDGGNSTLQNPLYTYDTPGNYMATLMITNSFGCIDTIQKNVLVNPLPIAAFSSDTVCVTSQTCLSDLSTIASGSINAWGWNFGDPISGSNTSTVQSPCHIFSSANTFNITLTVISDSGCQSSTVLPVLVNPFPVAGFTASNVCLNSPTLFNNTSSGAVQWSWNFGDGNNSSLQNPSNTYATFGNYTVTQIITSGANCIDTIVNTITVYPIPIVNFIASTVCIGDTTTFTNLSSIPTGTLTGWDWDFGDGNTSSLQNPTHVYTSSGIYNVTLNVTSNNNCQTAFTIPTIIYSRPIANFSYTLPGEDMLMDAVLFNDLSISNIISWSWDFGDGTLSTLMNPTHVYTDTGTYFITLIVADNNGCQDTINEQIEIIEFDFYIPNSFTPNGDENNEFFFGRGIGIIEYEMWIFNRWGNLIFTCHVNDLPQTTPCKWNGIIPGGATIYKQDVYVWKVRLKSVFKKEYNYMGYVNILR